MTAGSPARDAETLRAWIGREERADDVVGARLVSAFNATLGEAVDEPAPGAPVSHGIHWCLAPPIVATADLGPDGHQKRGAFVPPVPLPRRMWAGGRLEFAGRFHVADAVTRRSTIADVAVKEGRSGPLCFVTVAHEFATPRGPVLSERQDIVYRGGAAVPARPPAPDPHPPVRASRGLAADAVLLFRYSALTFNAHRIHYDRSYCVEEEGYPGLLVHAPLMATLLLHFAVSLGGDAIAAFDYRGRAPLFDGVPFTLNAADAADGLELWIADTEGADIMTARAVW